MLCTTWYPDGLVSLLISTSTNIMHSIWLTCLSVQPKYEAQTRIIYVFFCLSSRECRRLKFCGIIWYPDGLVSLVICTSTNLVHPTWLTRTIHVSYVSNLNICEACFWVGPICSVCLYKILYIFLHPSFIYYYEHVMNSFFRCLILYVLCVEILKLYMMYKGRVLGVYNQEGDCLMQVNEFGATTTEGTRAERMWKLGGWTTSERKRGNRIHMLFVSPTVIVVLVYFIVV
jgi:hypothetical protein